MKPLKCCNEPMELIQIERDEAVGKRWLYFQCVKCKEIRVGSIKLEEQIK